MSQSVSEAGTGPAPFRLRREHLVSVVAIIVSLIHLYAPVFGLWSSLRPTSLAAFTVLVFLTHPLKLPGAAGGKVVSGIIDAALIGLTLYIGWYVAADYNEFQASSSDLSRQDVVLGVLLVLSIMEATRRTIGRPLVILAVISLAYAYWGQQMPLAIAHKGADIETLVDFIFVQPVGIYGLPVGVTATYIVLFVLFGAFLEHSGAGAYFIEISRSLMGRRVGGPAKMAILSSAMMGSMSGSAVANVVTTGSFTIPLMIRMGLRRSHAAAIEAVASTGGMILPPVMGAAAFVMAEILGIGYGKVIVAALIPGLLYYVALYLVVHFESRKHEVRGLSEDEVQPLGPLLRECWWISVPIIVLFTTLMMQYSALRAVSLALLSLAVIVLLMRGPRFTMTCVIKALDDGARATAPILLACACAGIIIGVIFTTGIGLRFASIVLNLAGNEKFLVLFYTMLVTLVLGLGLPVTASYITAATLAVPALQAVGVGPVAAHMFVLYFSALSAITPPVALATYAGSGIAKANMWRSGMEGMRIGLTGFVIPFFFCYGSPLLILGSDPLDVVLATVSALFGIFGLATGLVGYFHERLNLLQRVMLILAGGLLIHFNLLSDLIALCLFAAALGPQLLKYLRHDRRLLNSISERKG